MHKTSLGIIQPKRHLKSLKWLGTRVDGLSRSSRYSGHYRRVRCICYYETRLFLLLAHKRPSPFFYTYPHKKPCFTLINDFVVDS